jgi:predicted RNA-binding Zn-ribbon protein involved in translation (DUF1610 family)
MPAGTECPGCGSQTFIDQESHRKCSQCGYVGWKWDTSVSNVGSGAGYGCPNCGQQKLHDVEEVAEKFVVYRCKTCDYTGIEPTDS